MKTQYGDEAEMLVEEILRQGQDTASSVIIRAATRLKETLKGNGSCFFLNEALLQSWYSTVDWADASYVEMNVV